jgi:putative FmdB family regulatory protein
MPAYQYRCAQCGEQFEARQSIHDDTLTVHDACGGALSKVFGGVGIVLKGPGFYRTDNRSSAGGDRKQEGDSKSTAATGNGSGDSKKKSDSGSKTETASSGASKTDSSKS